MTPMSLRHVAMLAAALLATTAVAGPAGVLHVDDDSPFNGDGLTWETAFANLDFALDAAAASGGAIAEIRVAGGTYVPGSGSTNRDSSFDLVCGVALLGGYAGVESPDPDERDPVTFVTVLSGDLLGNDGDGFENTEDNARNVVRSEFCGADTRLDGFTIRGGRYEHASGRGAGLDAASSSIHVERCVFEYCFAGSRGGAVEFSGTGSPVIRDCRFENNMAGGEGGGACFCVGASLIDCVFENNVAGESGGGLVTCDPTTIQGCTFRGNEAPLGGAFWLYQPTVITGCLFEDNVATERGGALAKYEFDATLELIACVFTGNTAVLSGGAIWSEDHVLADGCFFGGNHAGNDGGGAIDAGAAITLISCTLDGNSTDGRGGAVTTVADIVAAESFFADNTATLDGGAVYLLAPASASLDHTCLEGNTAGGAGGGVAVIQAEATLTACELVGNDAGVRGGGVYAFDADASIEASLFTGNIAGDHGGGLAMLDGVATTHACGFTDNTAGLGGGGVHNAGGGHLTATDCRWSSNTATLEGGGVRNDSATTNLYGGTFTANHAGSLGGGVVNTGSGDLLAVNCVWNGNTAAVLGGGLTAMGTGTLALHDSTLASNSAAIFGGGLFVTADTAVTIRNGIFRSNVAMGMSAEDDQIDGTTLAGVDIAYTCVEGWSGTLGGDGNFDADPLFRDADGPDGVPGTGDENLRLAAGSPCIDRGDNDAVPPDTADLDGDGDTTEPVPYDRDDHARFFDDPATPDGGNGVPPIVDLGAYEFDGEPMQSVPGGGDWFDPATWSAGVVPDALSDLVIEGPVFLGDPGAIARDIDVRSGGALTIDEGALTTHGIRVRAGGTLSIAGSTTDLAVTTLVVDPGATLAWTSGVIRVDAGGVFTQTVPLVMATGGPATLALQAGAVVEMPSIELLPAGTITGLGEVRADLVNGGVIEPGLPFGALEIVGTFEQLGYGRLRINVRRLDPDFDHARLRVVGLATLDGTLEITPIGGFEAQLGTSDEIVIAGALAGTFAQSFLPDFGGTLLWQITIDTAVVTARMTVPSPQLYVLSNGVDGLGTTWTSPAPDLQSALTTAANVAGDVSAIWIAEGTYVPTKLTTAEQPRSATFGLIDGVALYGGFAGGETMLEQRDPVAHVTVLSGDLAGDDGPGFENTGENAYRVVFANGETGPPLLAPVIIDGLTITGGNASEPHPQDGSRAGGLWLRDATIMLRDCRFVANQSFNEGAGAYLDEVDAVIRDCVFSENLGLDENDALSVTDGSVDIADCIFENNAASGASLIGEVIMRRCTFSDNTGHASTALVVGSSGSLVEDCVFTGNTMLGNAGLSVSGEVVVERCVFEQNHAIADCGAIRVGGSGVTVRDCDFTNNTAGDDAGALLAATPGIPSAIEGCRFTGNVAGTDGGAGFLSFGSLVFRDCIFTGNSADSGGGLAARGADPTLERCRFEDNIAQLRGGGLFCEDPLLTLRDVEFVGNTAGLESGGVHLVTGDAVIERCRFVGNGASGGGGGLTVGASTAAVNQCLFTGNTGGPGTAVRVAGLFGPVLTNCVIAHNGAMPFVAVTESGFVPRPRITNCVIRDNTLAGIETGIPPAPLPGASMDYTCSDIAIYPGVGNIDADPLFVDPAGPDGQPGTEDDDFRLSPGSPCIDAADSTALPPAIVVDLDDAPRYRDDHVTPDTGVGPPPVIDMGPYEYQPILLPGDVNGDGVVSVDDLVLVIEAWGDCDTPCLGDANGDGVVDVDDLVLVIAMWGDEDCNGNGIPDVVETADGVSPDCNGNQRPDSCDIADGISVDCNDNGIPDDCDIASGRSDDCDGDGVPDECQADCNRNGTPDTCDIADGVSPDCNRNGVPDECEIADGSTPDCNENGVPDSCDIADGVSVDCNRNGVPDGCETADGSTPDCNENGVPDSCELDPRTDCNDNGVLDDCEVADGSTPDCNGNGVPDSCDIADGTSADIDGNGVPDECDPDCNRNGVPDQVDIADGTSRDDDGDGVPDECTTPYSVSSGPLSPIGSGSSQQWTVPAPPLAAAGDVTLAFEAVGDFAGASRRLFVLLNGVLVGSVFLDGSTCPAIPDVDAIVLDAESYNDGLAGGDLVLVLGTSPTVDPAACAPADSYVAVTVDYTALLP